MAVLALACVFGAAQAQNDENIVTPNPPYWMTHGRTPQHQPKAPTLAQNLETILWQRPVDLAPQYSGDVLYAHYGSPLISYHNTILIPVKVGATDTFKVEARNGLTGALIWAATSDYSLPPHNWVPMFSPTMFPNAILAWPGAGGTIMKRGSVDVSGSKVSRQCFFGPSNYDLDRTTYNDNIKINTPLTPDVRGNCYFGYRALGDTPLHLAGGLAKVTSGGYGQYVSAVDATGDSDCIGLQTNCAPATTADGKLVYVVFQRASGGGYLCALSTGNLHTVYKVRLLDPVSGNDAVVTGDSTAVPVIGPDGDIYFGVIENPYFANHLRGRLLHFNKTLTEQKPTGAFGWDIMPSVLPASSVPSYHGTSSYLLLCKYNNYAGGGGDGINKLGILDPNDTQLDTVSGATVMKEVLTIANPTPDPEFTGSGFPNAVREWCINTAVVDYDGHAAYCGGEDGVLYKWDFNTNTFSQSIRLTPGIGEAYTPTIMGPTGIVYAINNATLFAVGNNIP